MYLTIGGPRDTRVVCNRIRYTGMLEKRVTKAIRGRVRLPKARSLLPELRGASRGARIVATSITGPFSPPPGGGKKKKPPRGGWEEAVTLALRQSVPNEDRAISFCRPVGVWKASNIARLKELGTRGTFHRVRRTLGVIAVADAANRPIKPPR